MPIRSGISVSTRQCNSACFFLMDLAMSTGSGSTDLSSLS